MAALPEMWTQEAMDAGCTCAPRLARSTDIDPPEPKRDRDCPLHGIDFDRMREDRDGR